MARPSPRTLTVISTRSLTANMIRITLGGKSLEDFPLGQEGGYVKLLFPQPSDSSIKQTDLNSDSSVQKPRMRTYTIRSFDEQSLAMDIDFVVHGDNGPASAWAMNAQVGDTITIVGPGAKKMVDLSADWFFIVGDMTALPAISVNLEKMPSSAKGYVVLEIIDEKDKQELIVPEGIEVHWLVNPEPEKPNSVLSTAVKALPWLEGTPSVWLATEFETMRAMRRYFKKERGVGRGEIYASSYWKIGETDEGNKDAKRNDSEAE